MARPHRGRGGAGGGRRGGGRQRLRAGQRLTWERPPWGRAGRAGLHRGALRGRRPPRRRQAAGVAHHAGGRALPRVDAARPGPGSTPGASPVHRLGRDTSGVVLRPDPGGPGRTAAGAAGAGASGRSTGPSARATPRPTPSTSTPPSARSPTHPPARFTPPCQAVVRRGAWSGSWSVARTRRRPPSSRWRSRPDGRLPCPRGMAGSVRSSSSRAKRRARAGGRLLPDGATPALPEDDR